MQVLAQSVLFLWRSEFSILMICTEKQTFDRLPLKEINFIITTQHHITPSTRHAELIIMHHYFVCQWTVPCKLRPTASNWAVKAMRVAHVCPNERQRRRIASIEKGRLWLSLTPRILNRPKRIGREAVSNYTLLRACLTMPTDAHDRAIRRYKTEGTVSGASVVSSTTLDLEAWALVSQAYLMRA